LAGSRNYGLRVVAIAAARRRKAVMGADYEQI
jgi:hypothetical protein